MSVANLANDFLECDAALNMSFRDAGSRRFCKPGIINYRLCGCPQGKRASTMNFALSSFSAELHYAALKSRDPDGDSSVLIDTAGYILGPEHGVFVAQTPQGVICASAFRPVLAKAVANRIATLGHKVAGDAIHLSDLAGCASFGWIGQDLTVWHASLRSLGAPVKSDESLAHTLQDLANVDMPDDIVVPF